jgi:hypothetical protein
MRFINEIFTICKTQRIAAIVVYFIVGQRGGIKHGDKIA